LHDVRIEVADSVCARLVGLIGRRGLPPGEALLLRPAGSVHTAFMRFAIDVVFLDRDLTVIDVLEGVRPWRVRARSRARAVLELAAGEAARLGITAGMTLRSETDTSCYPG
jgi:uncharacterized membrane protein (UPF0127 family)